MAKGVGDVLYSILSNDSDINAIVGTKIYPFLAIEDVVYPYIVYTIEGVDPTQTDDGVSTLDINSANIEIYTEDLAENETLSKYVRNALDRYQGTVEGIEVQSISFRSENGGYADADRVYLKIQDYSLRMFTIAACLGRVTDLAASSISEAQIDLSWSDVATGETGWEIWSSQDFISWTLVDTIAADSTSYSNTGLSGGTSYSYKIRAIDGTDNGEWSNIVIGAVTLINVSNSTDNYSVNTSTDLELPDNTIQVTNNVDTVLSTTYNPVYDNITIEVPIATTQPSGIAYQRPSSTGQLVSYATGDDGYHYINGTYDYTPPTNPVSIAALDWSALEPFKTLLYDNEYGDKNRFTDDVGTQVYANDLVKDHFTGLMYYRLLLTDDTWTNQMAAAFNSTQGGYSDWRVTNYNECQIINKQSFGGEIAMFYSPFNIANTSGNSILISTTRGNNSTQTYSFETIQGGRYQNTVKSTTFKKVLLVRNF